MPIPYAPLAAANFFIAECAESRGVEHMKLQKLVYFSHGWWLTAFDHPYLNERPEIWKHGPVFNSLYHVLKTFGGSPITSPQAATPFSPAPTIDGDDGEVRSLLKWIWQRYGHLSSFALSDMTHRAGTAWSRVAEERNFTVPRGLEIPDEYIRDEFRAQSLKENGGSETDGGSQENGGGRSAA